MISAVVTREVIEFFLRLAPLLDTDTTIEDQIIELFVSGIRECGTNPVVTALKEFEAESVSISLFDTEHSNYQLLLSALAMRLMAESFPKAGATQAAELITRITATLLLSPSNVLRTETDDEARKFAVTYFIPILDAARTVTE
ncbi:Putative transcriptional regulator, TetR family [Mycobacteroides abscessus subsp. bolletii]|nr:Putative transcriptional regulator, TetR family [Mycobacteroides abscessus subsp. bolletii]SHR73694.1 Putative transcriptional regulator, TetR family [Mycobacteroides abscessus subsp. bolletii]SHT16991.1 Putative transcriptional regulator, TetR family [Mycobacteroides abscessus subsp. bolletii]SKG05894.1 Putative transcriptional regulator, TetR family [Mycobacteroides abscessus subsp. bolletii]SKG72619.1 Putative transcriptional regulator, TetR family [Mycobacteroides abscessus subsp. bollet